MRRMLKSLRALSSDTRGGVLTYFAVLAPIFLGLMALVLDLSVWNFNKRNVQTAADAAAVAAALEIKRSGLGSVSAAVEEIVQANGFGGKSDTLTVNTPPAAGPLSGNANAVEVVLTREVPALLSSVFIKGPITVAARAVAVGKPTDVCVLALDAGSSGTVSVSGNAEVNLDCAVMANSGATDAIRQNGDACLSARALRTSGGAAGDCLSPEPMVRVPPTEDPLSALSAPDAGSCDHEATVRVTGSGESTLEPGHYCGGIEISGAGEVEFDPGLYVLGGAGLRISGTATVTGDGVGFYLTPSSRGVNISGGGQVSLAADAAGDLPGVLFYQDRSSRRSTNTILGGTDTRLDGILYFPKQHLMFAGGSEGRPTASLLIVNSVTFAGNTAVGDVEESPAMANAGLFQAYLVQ